MGAVKTGTWKFEPLAVTTAEAFESLDAPVRRIGARDVPIPSARPSRTTSQARRESRPRPASSWSTEEKRNDADRSDHASDG